MMLAHLGIAVFIVGVTLVKGYEIESDVRLDVGAKRDASAATSSSSAASRQQPVPTTARSPAAIDVRKDGRLDRDAASGEAHLQRVGTGDDRSPRSTPASSAISTCRSASRSADDGDRRRVGRARLSQAVRRLDLERRVPDGAGRLPRGVRSPLPPRVAQRSAAMCGAAAAPARMRRHDDEDAALVDPARDLRRPGRFPLRRPLPRPARSAVAADRQAGAGVQAGAAARAGQDARPPTSRARCGCSMSGRRGACRAASSIRCWWSSRKAEHRAGLSASTTRTSPTTGSAWLAQNGNPYTASVVDADGRVGIDYGVYGVPETFVDRQGRRRSATSRSARSRARRCRRRSCRWCASCRSEPRARVRRRAVAIAAARVAAIAAAP